MTDPRDDDATPGRPDDGWFETNEAQADPPYDSEYDVAEGPVARGGPPEDKKAGGVLGLIERVGNLLPDPTFLFIAALGISFWLSWHFAGSTFETAQGTREVVSQVTPEALVDFLTKMVGNFTGFSPLGVVLVAMLGVGVAEHTGYIGTGLKILLKLTPRAVLTPALALIAIVSHTAVDAGYVLVIPVGGILFHAAGRHPLAGIAAAFAGVSGGFSANFIPSALDFLLQGFTQDAGRLVNPELLVNPLCNWFFAIASSVLVVAVIWIVTDAVIEPRLNRQATVDGKDLPVMERIGWREVLGFFFGTATLVAMLVGLYYWAQPSDSPLRDAEGSLVTFTSPLMQSIVPILFVIGVLPGVIHGVLAGTVRSLNDIVTGMIGSMKGMAHYVVIAFFIAQFLYVFNTSNLGQLLAVTGAETLKSWQLPAAVTVVGAVLLTAFVNLLIGSASAKWGLLSVILVPLMMELGFSPALTQAAYRVGDSTTNIVTPLMPYFPLVVTYCQRYVTRTGIGTLLSMMIPYSFTLLVSWTILLIAYWFIGGAVGLPLGIEGGYEYPPVVVEAPAAEDGGAGAADGTAGTGTQDAGDQGAGDQGPGKQGSDGDGEAGKQDPPGTGGTGGGEAGAGGAGGEPPGGGGETGGGKDR